MLSVYDLIARYANHPDCASAVGAVVRGLEVETNKRQGDLRSCGPAAVGSSSLQECPPSLAAGYIV